MERARELLPEIIGKLDEPMGDSSLMPTYLLCQETRKHVTVALAGDGGDELLPAMTPFGPSRWLNGYDRLVPGPVHQAIRMAVAALPSTHRNMSLDFRLKRTLRGLSYPRRLWNAVWLDRSIRGIWRRFSRSPPTSRKSMPRRLNSGRLVNRRTWSTRPCSFTRSSTCRMIFSSRPTGPA